MEKTEACGAGLVSRIFVIGCLLLATSVARSNVSGHWQVLLEKPEHEFWQGQPASFLVMSLSPPDTQQRLVIAPTDDFLVTEGTPVPVHKDGVSGIGYPVQLTPLHSGSLALPLFSFQGYEHKNHKPEYINVRAPVLSEKMSIKVAHSSEEIFLGQSVRLRFEWITGIHPKSLRSVKIFIPELENQVIRSREALVFDQFDADELIGLPIGNRRVLSRWENLPDNQVRFYFDYVIQPRQEGTFQLESPILLASVNTDSLAYRRREFKGMRFSSHFNNNFFDEPFVGKNSKYERIMAQGEPYTLRVKGLPEAPPEFTGLVGRPDIQMSADVEQVNIGDPIKLEFLVSHPDLEFFELPDLKQQQAFERAFDMPLGPDPAEYRQGRKVISQTLFASNIEINRIPGLNVHYFDPQSGHYRDILVNSVPVQVSQGKRFSLSDGVLPEGVELSNAVVSDDSGIWAHRWTDIYTSSSSGTKSGSGLWLILFIIIPPLLFMAAMIPVLWQYWQGLRQQQEFIRFRTQVLAGKDPLAELGAYLYSRTGLQPSRLNGRVLMRHLGHKGIQPELVEPVCDWIELYQEQFSSSAKASSRVDIDNLIHSVRKLDAGLGVVNERQKASISGEARA